MTKLYTYPKKELEKNQVIVAGLRAAIAEYAGKPFTARFQKVLRKQFTDEFLISVTPSWKYDSKKKEWTSDPVSVSISSDRSTNVSTSYRIHVGYFNEYISISKKGGALFGEWESQLSRLVEEFNDLDAYQWHLIRNTAVPKLDRLNKKVLKLRKEAQDLMKSLPLPEYNVLGRYGGDNEDDTIKRTYQALFRYIDDESYSMQIKKQKEMK